MEKKHHPLAILIGLVIGTFITGLMLMWYDYVWLQTGLRYLQYCLISWGFFAAAWVGGKAWKSVMSILFGASIIAQVLNWMDLLSFPIIHLNK